MLVTIIVEQLVALSWPKKIPAFSTKERLFNLQITEIFGGSSGGRGFCEKIGTTQNTFGTELCIQTLRAEDTIARKEMGSPET